MIPEKRCIVNNKAVEVEIFGQRLLLKCDVDEEYVQELARYVDAHMRSLAQTMKTGTPTKLAILTAMNIADQLFQQERRSQAGQAELERRTEGIIERIEQYLASQPL